MRALIDWTGPLLLEALGALELWFAQQLRLPQKDRTSSASMIDQYLSHFSEVLCARPITLKFSHQGTPRDRLGSRSHEPADSHVVRFRCYATRCVGDHVYIVAVPHRVDSGHCKAHLCIKCCDDQFLPAGPLHRLKDAAVLPRG